MRNLGVDAALKKCREELEDIGAIKKIVGPTSSIMMFLTRYSLIKACGTVEFAYKTIISDFCDASQNQQIKNFITNKVRNSSRNPSLENIHSLLGDFDEHWVNNFKENFQSKENHDKLALSLKSLNDARNDFAHGGDPTLSFENVIDYFEDACIILEVLDEIVNTP